MYTRCFTVVKAIASLIVKNGSYLCIRRDTVVVVGQRIKRNRVTPNDK